RVVGFSHGGGRLLGSELRYLRRRAFAQHPSGREDLDDPSARADLLADRFPHLIGSIGNASDLGPVTAGGRHAPASGDDPRSFDHAALDRAAELDHRSHRPQYRPPMPDTLLERLRARDLVLPDYAGGGLINVAATMLDILGARNESDPLPLRDLSVALREGVRQVLVVLADGLGLGQLRALCASGNVPFLASLLDRAGRNDGAQLIEG